MAVVGAVHKDRHRHTQTVPLSACDPAKATEEEQGEEEEEQNGEVEAEKEH